MTATVALLLVGYVVVMIIVVALLKSAPTSD